MGELKEETVKHIAEEVGDILLSDTEIEKLVSQLNALLRSFQEMEKLDLADIAPTTFFKLREEI